jgi:hypothetical protein
MSYNMQHKYTLLYSEYVTTRKCILSLFFALCSLFCITISTNAQQSSTLFFMHTIPQSNLTNPAVQIPCKVFVGVPLLSSIHANYSNTFFSYNDLIYNTADDSLDFNYNHFLSKPNTRQNIAVEMHVSLINFGFLYNEYYFNFNISDKIETGVTYPTNLFGLVLNGNTPQVGQTYDLSHAALNAIYYREWAFGVSKIIDEQLTLGVKAKLLFGKANLRTVKSDFTLHTAPATDAYDWTINYNVQANMSPFVATYDVNGNVSNIALADKSPAAFLLNRKNKGIAFDFGAIYNYDEKITLSGSLLDLGLIRWKDSPLKLNSNGTINFNGIDANLNNLNQLVDSVENSVNSGASEKPYFSFLSPKMYLGATYSLRPSINAGLLTRQEIRYGKWQPSVTASLNTWYTKYLTGSVSWSWINNSFANFGLGVGARTPNFGLYIISDNVYGMFKYKSARLENIRFGLNLLFGCSECEKAKAKKAGKSSSCAAYDDGKKKRFEAWKKRMKK